MANTRSLRWIKAVVILERASKLVFLDPEDSSEHARAHRSYAQIPHPGRPPHGYLEQPKYRVPAAYAETKLALGLLLDSCGEDGVFPVDKISAAVGGEMVISPGVMIFVSPPFQSLFSYLTRRLSVSAPYLRGYRDIIARYQLARMRECRSAHRCEEERGFDQGASSDRTSHALALPICPNVSGRITDHLSQSTLLTPLPL